MERKRMGDSSSLSACAMSAKKDTAYNRTPSVRLFCLQPLLSSLGTRHSRYQIINSSFLP